jgi:cytochrome o ubiquinol oxidase subunit 2
MMCRWIAPASKFVALSCLGLSLAGCEGILDPRGPIGRSERLILLDSLAIMLAIVVPVILATFGFAWWFRVGNPRATYKPNWAFSGTLELLVWAIPALVITFLGGIAWFGSHALDPYRPLQSEVKPVEVEVVSFDWKWLFIYVDEGVATVNDLVIPVGAPVHFRLTSSGVMNSFFVPQLGSQIYTMAGMTTQVSLLADQPGDYRGLSAQFSGQGFADMRFMVRAAPPELYAQWLEDAKKAGPTLDRAAFKTLAEPNAAAPTAIYRSVEPGLFEAIVQQSIHIPALPGGRGGRGAPVKSTKGS